MVNKYLPRTTESAARPRARSAAINSWVLRTGLRFYRDDQVSAGSGVIVDAKLGHVLTNHHVIKDAKQILVTLKDGRQLEAKLLGSDVGTDIALLKVVPENLTSIRFADSDALRVGDYVLAIVNPFGLGQTVSSGIVSALGRTGLNIEGYEDFIQTDASINPGNSGGALTNLRGELVGINTAIFGSSSGNIGIGFAVPSNMARTVMAFATGQVRNWTGPASVHLLSLTRPYYRPQSADHHERSHPAGCDA